MTLFILAGTVFLVLLAFGVFAVLVVSIHRAAHAPLSKTRGKRAGKIARRALIGIGTGSGENTE